MNTISSAARRTSARDTTGRLVLHGIDWDAYEKLGEALGERNIHLTYDRGALEIMVVSFEHESYKHLFALVVITLARFFKKKVIGAGSFTHQRKDLARALEPDQCFYFTHLDAVRGKKRIDLERDPPPDLAIEIEISRSALDRMGIYAALGVPEVWRFDGKSLHAHLFGASGYTTSRASLIFPDVALARLPKFLRLGQNEDDVAMIDALEGWLRGMSRKKKKPRE